MKSNVPMYIELLKHTLKYQVTASVTRQLKEFTCRSLVLLHQRSSLSSKHLRDRYSHLMVSLLHSHYNPLVPIYVLDVLLGYLYNIRETKTRIDAE